MAEDAPTEPVAPSPWRDALGLAALALAVFCLLALRPPVGSDMRYQEACWEMVHGGGWLVPHLCFVPYMEKPIMVYWLGAACQWLLGPSPVAAQLPSGIASALSVAMVYLWSRAWRGRRFALLASLCLLGSGMFLIMGSILTTDPLLAACLLAAFASFQRAEARPGSGWIWSFWLAAAFAALVKGPLAWVLLGCGIAPYLALTRRPIEALRAVVAMRPLRGLLILIAVNAPWWAAVWRVDPRYVEFFFVRINLQGFVDPNVNHPGPAWTYLAVLGGGLFPLSVALLPPACLRIWRAFAGLARSRWGRGRGDIPLGDGAIEPYLACCLLGPLAFLSLSASKLPTYVLPLFPMLVMLGARGLDELLAAPPPWLRWWPWAQAGLIGLAGAAALAAGLRPDLFALISAPAIAGMVAALLFFVTGACLAGGLGRTGRMRAALAMLGGSAAVAAILSGAFVTELRMRENAGPLAAVVASRAAPGDEVIVNSYLCQDYSIIERLHRRMDLYGQARELGMGHFTECTPVSEPLPFNPEQVSGDHGPRNARLISDEELIARWRAPGRIWIFGDDGLVDHLKRQCLRVFEAGRTRKAVLLTNWPPPKDGA